MSLLSTRNMDGERGPELVCAHFCTLADFTSGGATTPTVGMVVTPSAGGNWYVKEAANDATKRLGVITKVTLAPTGTALGIVEVKWLDAVRVVKLATDDLTTTALIQSAIVDGAGNLGNFDAGSTTGPLVVVSESAASGAGHVYCIAFFA